MILAKKYKIKVDLLTSKILKSYSFAATKLWNICLYQYENYLDFGFSNPPSLKEQEASLKENYWYKRLPSQTSQMIIRKMQESQRSYRVLSHKYPDKNYQPPKPKKKGSLTMFYLVEWGFKIIGSKLRITIPRLVKEEMLKTDAVSLDYLYLSKEIKEQANQISIKHIQKNEFELIIYYKKEQKEIKKDNGKYISIDLGINNLFTVFDNSNGNSFIISGSSYLNTCFYYERKIAKYQSLVKENNYSTKRINGLKEKEKRIINYIIHKSTREIVKYCESSGISKAIIGDIKNIRQDKHYSKKLNQKIHSYPYERVRKTLEYKLLLSRIECIYVDEAYSSQCSPLSQRVDKEYANKSQRKCRGLFVAEGNVYNSDAVGAFNIMRIHYQNTGKVFENIKFNLSSPLKVCIPVTQ